MHSVPSSFLQISELSLSISSRYKCPGDNLGLPGITAPQATVKICEGSSQGFDCFYWRVPINKCHSWVTPFGFWNTLLAVAPSLAGTRLKGLEWYWWYTVKWPLMSHPSVEVQCLIMLMLTENMFMLYYIELSNPFQSSKNSLPCNVVSIFLCRTQQLSYTKKIKELK